MTACVCVCRGAGTSVTCVISSCSPAALLARTLSAKLEVGTGANQVWRSAAHNVVLAGSVVAAFGAGAASAGIANEMMAGATQDVGTDFAGERLENNNDKGDGSDENNKERLPNQPLRPTGLRNVAS